MTTERDLLLIAVRVLLLLLLSRALPGSAMASQDPGDPGRQQSRQRQQSSTPAASTASITGRVYAGDSGRPVRRARVLVRSSELPSGRSTTTGEDGGFEITELPAGRYTITASKTGYVNSAYGQRRPLAPGTPIDLAVNQARKNIDITLVPGGVITGHVLDDMSEPQARVTVRVARYQYAAGQRMQTVIGTDQTDDRGEFRVYGLPPGSYVVSAVVPQASTAGDAAGGRGGGGRGGGGRGGGPGRGMAPPDTQQEPEITTYVPTYYPGVPSAVDGVTITVGPGQEVSGIDFPLQLYRAVRVSGTVVSANGEPITGGQVFLSAEDSRGGLTATSYSARVGSNGAFSISTVATGRYLLTARVASDETDPMFARQPLSLGDQDLAGVTVTARAGGWLGGTVAFESTPDTAPPLNLGRVRVQAIALTPVQFGGRGGGPGGTSFDPGDGTFLCNDVPPGLWTLSVTGVPAPWTVAGVFLGGRDVTDTGIEARPGEGVEDLKVLMTASPSQVTGTVESSSGTGLNDYAVVAFSADASHWRPQSRRIRVVRTDTAGRFTIEGLPAGTYLLAATPDVDEGEWYEPSFLEELKPSASQLTIGDGETKTLTIRIKSGGGFSRW